MSACSPVSVRSSSGASVGGVKQKARHLFLGLPENRAAACVGILDVKHRIVRGLLVDLDEIEVQRRIVLAHQHHEADRVASDLVHDLAHRDEIARTLGHLHGLAATQEPDQLAEPDDRPAPARAWWRSPTPPFA